MNDDIPEWKTGTEVMKNIPVLYHWAPRESREGILEQGLVPRTPSGNWGLCVCLGTSPAEAWELSGEIRTRSLDSYAWDLYQVHVADTLVHIVQHWGRDAEYRIPRTIKAQGIALVASRNERT